MMASGVDIAKGIARSAAADHVHADGGTRFQQVVADQQNVNRIHGQQVAVRQSPLKPPAPVRQRCVNPAVIQTPTQANEPSDPSIIGKLLLADLLTNDPEALSGLKEMLGLKPGDVPANANLQTIIGTWRLKTGAKQSDLPNKDAAA